MVSTAPVRVVITGAGAPGIRGTIYALRNNPDGREIFIVSVDVANDVVGRYLSDEFERVPPPEAPGYIDEIRRVCQRHSASIIIPQTTREVAALACYRQLLNRFGIKVMVSDNAAVEAANNKSALLVTFKALGLPFPDFRLAKSEGELSRAAEELGYPARPVVVKPPVSNGMRGVRVLRTDAWDVRRFLEEKPTGLEIALEDLLQILRRGPDWPELLVTQYLPGPEYTVDVFVGEHLKVAVPRQRRAIRSGITFQSETELRSDLCDFSLCAAQHLGLRYAFGFQFKLDSDGVPRILECNPRIQGTMVASTFSGANVIWLGVRELLGDPATALVSPLSRSQFYRFWGGIGVHDGNIYEI